MCSDIIMDDGCSFIVQAAVCTASYLLQQCGKPQKKSHVGRVAIRCARHSVHEIYSTLGADYFRHAYRMSYKSFWQLHSKLATRINTARLTARRYVPKGGREGGDINCHLFKMGAYPRVSVWHVHCEFLQGARFTTS